MAQVLLVAVVMQEQAPLIQVGVDFMALVLLPVVPTIEVLPLEVEELLTEVVFPVEGLLIEVGLIVVLVVVALIGVALAASICPLRIKMNTAFPALMHRIKAEQGPWVQWTHERMLQLRICMGSTTGQIRHSGVRIALTPTPVICASCRQATAATTPVAQQHHPSTARLRHSEVQQLQILSCPLR